MDAYRRQYVPPPDPVVRPPFDLKRFVAWSTAVLLGINLFTFRVTLGIVDALKDGTPPGPIHVEVHEVVRERVRTRVETCHEEVHVAERQLTDGKGRHYVERFSTPVRYCTGRWE